MWELIDWQKVKYYSFLIGLNFSKEIVTIISGLTFVLRFLKIGAYQSGRM
jgi:hypothetical protein